MFSIQKAASIFYYLGHDGEDTHEPLAGKGGQKSESDKGNYYISPRSNDPLASTATWAGGLAQLVGLKAGSEVNLRQLAALWYGFHPDGSTPLDQRGITFAEQRAAQKLVGAAETHLFQSLRAMQAFRAQSSSIANEVKAGRRNQEDLLVAKSKVEAQQVVIQQAQKDLELAQKSKAYRTCAHDLTFSAPKSVSIYWAALKSRSLDEGAADRDAAAREAARIEAMIVKAARRVCENVIEPDLVFTRKRNGPSHSRTYENVKGLAFALVPHFESRPTVDEAMRENPNGSHWRMPDPQLHVHGLMMAMGQDYDDEVRAIWTKFLSTHAHGIGAAFRAELAAMLREEGLDLRATKTSKIDAFELAGVSDEQIGSFSKRRESVLAGLSAGKSGQEAVLADRNAKRDYSSEEMLTDWAARLADEKVSTQSIRSAKAAPQNAHANREAMIQSVLKELLQMTGAIRLRDIHRKAYEAAQHASPEQLGELSPIEWAKQLQKDIISHRSMVVGNRFDHHGLPVFTTARLQERERALYFDHVFALKKAAPTTLISTDEANRAIAAAEAFLAKEKNIEKFEFADFQNNLVAAMASSKESLRIALAPAGCGKTTAALAACMAFESQGLKFHPLAPSNKAAQQLAKDLYKSASKGRTPQSLLASIKKGTVKLTSNDVLFVDEASMLDFETADKLVRAALAAEGGPARLILMGDTEQLPSVGRGNFLRRVVSDDENNATNTGGSSVVTRVIETEAEWAKISRQKSDIGKQATALLALGENARALEIYRSLGAVRLCFDKDSAIEELVGDAIDAMETQFSKLEMAAAGNASILAMREVRDALCSTALLASTRSDVAKLNHRVRESLADRGYFQKSGGGRITMNRGAVGTMEIREGERIIFSEAMKGLIGQDGDPAGAAKAGRIAKSICATVRRVERIGKKARLVVELDGDKPKSIATLDLDHFSGIDYAYATTIHKAQGATVERSYELFSSFAAKELDYVAKSRYRCQHRIYGARHEFESYQKSLSHLTEKVEARDVGVMDLSVFAPDPTSLTILDAESSNRDARLEVLKNVQIESRLRHIAQGTLVSMGEAEVDKLGRPRRYVTIEVDGVHHTYEGVNLADAFHEAGISVGDHVGLEAVSPELGAAISGVKWKWHTKEALSAAGLLIDSQAIQGVEAGASTSPILTRAKQKIFDEATMALAPHDVQIATMLSTIRTSLQNTALQVREIASMESSAAHVPEISSHAAELAYDWLPYALPILRKAVQHAISSNDIEIKTGQALLAGRTWLSHADGVAFALDSTGTIEAWHIDQLPQAAQNEILSRDSLATVRDRREKMLVAAQNVATDMAIVGDAQSHGFEIRVVDHLDHGISLVVGAAPSKQINTSSVLKAMFDPAKDEASPSTDGRTSNGVRTEKGTSRSMAIKDHKWHQGFDNELKGYIFSLEDLDRGTLNLKSSGPQELFAYFEMIGQLTQDGHGLEDADIINMPMQATSTPRERAVALARELNADTEVKHILELTRSQLNGNARVIAMSDNGLLIQVGKFQCVAEISIVGSPKDIKTMKANVNKGRQEPISISRSKSGNIQITCGPLPQ